MSNDQNKNDDVPSYKHILWHLEKVGVLSEHNAAKAAGDVAPLKAEHWPDGLPQIKVAIIDSGCTTRHPKLQGKLLGQIDFGPSLAGAVYEPTANDVATKKLQDEHEKRRQDLKQKIASVLASLPAEVGKLIQDVLDNFCASPVLVINERDPADYLSGHGTACAGLVAAGTFPKDPKPKNSLSDFPYFGVNPFAKIIPIATAGSHEVLPVIHGLFHALAMDADVILLPRGVPQYVHKDDVAGTKARDVKQDLRRSRFDSDETLAMHTQVFEALLQAIALDRPVILAAGNEGGDKPEYPASLGSLEGSSIIVVGAANAHGVRASYSSGTFGTGVTVFAPSDDEERITQEVLRFDNRFSAGKLTKSALAPYSPGNQGAQPDDSRLYSGFSVLALEPPGRLLPGENANLKPEDMPLTALYSQFGGTSAASAIVAGLVSLHLAHAAKTATAVPSVKVQNAGQAVKEKITPKGLNRTPGKPFGSVALLNVSSLV